MKALMDAIHRRGPGVCAVIAAPGGGKTTFLRYLLTHWPGPRVAVDPWFTMRGYDRTHGVKYSTAGADDWLRFPKGAVVCVDEIDRLMARGPATYNWTLELVNICRNASLNVVWTARRPPMVHRDCRELATVWIVGAGTSELDLSYVREKCPAAADFAARARLLQLAAFVTIADR